MKTKTSTRIGLAATALALALTAPAVASAPDAEACPASLQDGTAVVELALPPIGAVGAPQAEAIAGEVSLEVERALHEASAEIARAMEQLDGEIGCWAEFLGAAGSTRMTELRHQGIETEPADGFGLADVIVLATKVPVRMLIAMGTAVATVVGDLVKLA